MKNDNPRGDDARAGAADLPQRTNKGKGSLGAGKEATGGVAKDGRAGDTGEADRSRTAPLRDHGTDKGSGYGGNKGGPKTSSDQQ